jgi:hypothetical protein
VRSACRCETPQLTRANDLTARCEVVSSVVGAHICLESLDRRQVDVLVTAAAAAFSLYPWESRPTEQNRSHPRICL